MPLVSISNSGYADFVRWMKTLKTATVSCSLKFGSTLKISVIFRYHERPLTHKTARDEYAI